MVDPQLSEQVPARAFEIAERLAATVRGHPNVTRLHGGTFGDITTPLPGRYVTGVRIGDQRIEIGLVVDENKPLPDVAVEVRTSVVQTLRGHGVPVRPVDITIAELEHSTPHTSTSVNDISGAGATSG